MKNLKLFVSLILVSIFFAPTIILAEDKNTGASVGEIVKDSAITTQIKAKIVGEKGIDSLHIKVVTDNNGIVVLSGAVKNTAEKEKVHNLAHSVDGVQKVVNNLKIDPDLFK